MHTFIHSIYLIISLGNGDFRNMFIENSVLLHVNGSSRVKISDAIDIICSVKVEITQPSSLTPDEGLVEVNVDISPACNLKMDERRTTNAASQIAEFLERMYIDTNAIDRNSLCIIKGKTCWAVYIDLMVCFLF